MSRTKTMIDSESFPFHWRWRSARWRGRGFRQGHGSELMRKEIPNQSGVGSRGIVRNESVTLHLIIMSSGSWMIWMFVCQSTSVHTHSSLTGWWSVHEVNTCCQETSAGREDTRRCLIQSFSFHNTVKAADCSAPFEQKQRNKQTEPKGNDKKRQATFQERETETLWSATTWKFGLKMALEEQIWPRPVWAFGTMTPNEAVVRRR